MVQKSGDCERAKVCVSWDVQSVADLLLGRGMFLETEFTDCDVLTAWLAFAGKPGKTTLHSMSMLTANIVSEVLLLKKLVILGWSDSLTC